jgi:hypothetical protein
MFERDISEAEVEKAVSTGLVIEAYKDDKPYPSYLCLKHLKSKVLHVVYAKDEPNSFVIITVYEPDPKIWNDDFQTKRTKE